MSDVYRNAYFTISAAHTSSCHLSFLQPRSSLFCNGININLPSGNTPTQVGTRLLSNPDTFLPLDLRGWTLQEQHLSTRILRFTEHEMIWICRTLTDCECGAHPKVFPWKHDLQIGHNEDNPDSWWLRIAENFSKWQLSFDSDKLPALAGIAAVEHERTGDQYLAGLWKGEILIDICWHPISMGPTPYRSLSQYKIPVVYRAPSFSWASINGPVAIRTPKGQFQAKLLDAEIKLAGLNPFGQVSGGYMVLECPTVELTLVCTGTFDEENVVPSPGPARPGTTITGHCYFLQRKDKLDTVKPFNPDAFVANNTIELESGSLQTTTRRIEPDQTVHPFQCTVLAANIWHMDEQDFLSFGRGWIRECSRKCLILAVSEHMGAYERIGCTAFGYQKDDAVQTDWFFGAERSVIKIV